jgi:hypothetical protein
LIEAQWSGVADGAAASIQFDNLTVLERDPPIH